MRDLGNPRETDGIPPRLPTLSAGASIAIGLTVLFGWAVGNEPLKAVVPGLITMKPNAALGFVLAGGAVAAIRRDRRWDRPAAGLALSVVTLGVLTVFEYVSGLSLGIDEILFRDQATGATGWLRPGRMHPTTALDFAAIGTALTLIALDRGRRAAGVIALVAGLVAGSALIGYAFGVRRFVGLAAYNQMALHTSIGMLALVVGAMTARPGPGVIASIAGNAMARRLLPVAIVLPITLDGLALLSNHAHLFDERFATSIRVVATIAILVACIGGNAHAMRRADRDRLHVEGRYRFLAEAMPQIIWTARPDGSVDYMNRRWSELTGQGPDDYEGLGWGRAVHPEDLPRCRELWGRATGGGLEYEIEYRILRTDGSYRWHLGRGTPMRDETGTIVQWVGNCSDIHDGKLADEQRFRSLVEATAAIVWNTPESGEFQSEQPSWGLYTGQRFDQLKGWGWLDAVHPDDRAKTVRAWSEAVASRSRYSVEHRLRRHDGEYRHMVVRAVPVMSGGGAICEWVGVHTDIDAQKRSEAALREAKDAAETATRAKGEFLANMSHEIRTPMNGVLGMTELVLGTDLTARQREYLGLAKSSADALLKVIDDILDFSKIEAGKLGLDPIPFDLRNVVADTLQTLAFGAQGKGLELACRVAPGVPASVVGDPGRLRQILMNLVGNAVKFTDHGEVCVTVEEGPAGAPTRQIRVAVADTGIGIPPHKRAAVFAPFEQADGSTTRKFGGTGLGLSISCRLVELMGGQIRIEDNPGGGSIFRFDIHLPERPGCGPTPGPDLADAARLAGLPVLIVDDSRTTRLILEELLTHWGCRPVSVSGGPEAFEALSQADARGDPFRVVLLDRVMPGMDGHAVAARIGPGQAREGLKVVMLTSGGLDESDHSRGLGVAAFLSKPVRQSELFEALLGRVETPRPTRQTGEKSQGESRAGIVPASRLRVLLAEDHPVNQKVAARMLEQQGHAVKVVGDGHEAVSATAGEDFDVVLMDVQMPVMDGFMAVAAIRSRERQTGLHVPIIALTAHAMAGDRDRCLKSGFDDYLAKPIQLNGLREALDRLTASPGLCGPPPLAAEPRGCDGRDETEDSGRPEIAGHCLGSSSTAS